MNSHILPIILLDSVCAYYIPSEKLKILYNANGGTSEHNGRTSEPKGGTSEPNGGTSNTFNEIPKELKDRIDHLGKRLPKDILFDLIIQLCTIKPFSGEELAKILGRSETHIKNKIIPALIEKGRLRFTYSEMINHPNQKYSAELLIKYSVKHSNNQANQ